MALKITGLEQTIKKLRNAAARHEIKVTEAYRNFVWTVFEDVVRHTPQWSGNLASNWRLEVGGAWVGHGGYRQHPHYAEEGRKLHLPPLYAGHPAATTSALEWAAPAILRVRWNSIVRVVNYSPYAEDVEAGIGPDDSAIRETNKHRGPNVPAHGIAMVEYAITKYGKYTYRNLAYAGKLQRNIWPVQ